MSDSIWSLLVAFGMNFSCNPMDALDITMQNLSMFNLVTPSYNSKEKDGEKLNGDDPKNSQKIRKALFG